MPLKIRPNSIEQEEGHFIFPGVIALDGLNEFLFDAAGVTGSALISARDTSSGFKTPVTIRGSAIHLVGNENFVALRVEEGGGQGWFRINPTAKDYDLEYLADDGTVLLYGDAGIGHVIVGGDAMLGGLTGKLGVIDGSLVVMRPTGSTSTAAFTLSQEGAWITGSSGVGRFSYGARFSGEFVVYDWGLERDVMRFKSGQVMIGAHADPARILHVQSGPDLFVRLDTTGSSTASQIEYWRGGVGSYFGPTSGNEFHLWSLENIPLVIGLNNTEELRVTPALGTVLPDDRYFQFGAYPTGSAAWPSEPSADDWKIFGQVYPRSNGGITPYVRHNGLGAWGYPQPIVPRKYDDFRAHDGHMYGPVYYTAGQVNALAPTTGAPAINQIHSMPFFVNQRFVVTEIGFYVTVAGGAGSVARVGIYDNVRQNDSRADRLIYDGGEKDTNSTGVKSTSSISVELIPGHLYWFVYLAGVAAPTIQCLSPGGVVNMAGYSSIANNNAQIGFSNTYSYAALPPDISGFAGGNLTTVDPLPAIKFSIA